MKKILVSLICFSVLLSGCSTPKTKKSTERTSDNSTSQSSHKESTTLKTSATSSKSDTQINQSVESISNENDIIEQKSSSSQEQIIPEQETPIDDWKTTFEETLYKNYKVTVKNYVDYGDGYFGVFVNEVDTGDQAFVTVNSATGNFHG